MDEMTMFAELRPTESSLTEADLADLRAELFPTATPLVRPDGHGQLIDLAGRRITGQRDRRRALAAVAAAVIAVVGLGGVWLAADRNADTETAVPSAQASDSSPAVEPAPALSDPYALPRFAFADAGWTMTDASEASYGAGRTVVFLSDHGFDGPWVDITVSPVYAAGSLPEVDFGAISAQVSEFDNGSLVYWTEPGGRLLEAYGWHVDSATVANLFESTTLVDGVVTVENLPDGATLADRNVADAVGRHGSYRFAHTDGRTLEVNLSGGGDRALYRRVGDEDRTTLSVGGEEWSLLDYGGDGVIGRYRADVLRDFWTWEFDGESFASQDAFVETIAGIQTVDEATWEANLSDSIVSKSDQADTITALLNGVPLPEGFDIATLSDGTTNDRYQFIAHVSGAVACAWLDQWFTGVETAATDLQAAAAAALATAHDWPMLAEIADRGGWSDVLWQHADAVNGGEGVLTGAGPTAPTRDEANSALGCEI
jgi:hypothetical protein